MKKRGRILLFAMSGMVVSLALWMLMPVREPHFRGQPASHWITNIVYFGSEEQTAQWRSFGPDGVRLLGRALDRCYGFPYTYRRLFRRYAYRLPHFVASRLPDPVESRSTRMHILSLLSQLSSETNLTHLAEPIAARALKDEDSGVSMIALGWYSSCASSLNPEIKKTRLTDFLRLIQDDDLRNNAAGVLRHYRENAATVAPVLAGFLQETNPQIWLTIAGALSEVDPSAAVKAGVVSASAEILKHPNDQIAYRAADLLGTLRAEPAVSVPALVEGSRHTNNLIAICSMAALVKFREPMELIRPALTNALDHPHSRMRRYARETLDQIATNTNAKP